MKQLMYGMRRANGDWFAQAAGGRGRVPVFRTPGGAWRARAKNPAEETKSVLLATGACADRTAESLSPGSATAYPMRDGRVRVPAHH